MADFYRHLNSAWRYPFSSAVAIVMIVFMGLFLTGVRMLGGIFVLGAYVVLCGYFCSYLWSVFNETAQNRHEAPGSPDFSDIGSFVEDLIEFFLATLAPFFPAVALLVYALFSANLGQPWVWIVFLLLMLFGIVYYPVSLMLVAYSHRGVTPFNFALGIDTIRKVPKAYGITVLYFVATFLGAGMFEGFVKEKLLAERVVVRAPEKPETKEKEPETAFVPIEGGEEDGESTWTPPDELEAEMAGDVEWTSPGMLTYLIVGVIITWIELVLAVMQMRVVALLYLTHEEKLGWNS